MSLQLCRLSDLPVQGSKGFDLPQTRLFVVRDYSGVYVYLNRCPHLGIPLQWRADRFLDNDGHYILCSNHGALFEKNTGLCLQGPCRGESLWQIENRIENGFVIIEEDELPALPAVPQ